MIPLGNKEQLLSANKAIEKLLKEGGVTAEGAAEEEETKEEGVPQEEKDAEGDVADASNQEEIGGNLADMSPQDIDELAEVQDLDSNQVQQLQAQVQGARKSSRIAAQAPTTPVGRGTRTLVGFRIIN